MFYGCNFTFNGTSCSDFGLMMYNFGDNKSSGFTLTSPAEYDSDDSRQGFRNLYYGQKQKEPLVFDITFGIDTERLERTMDIRNPRFLLRREINEISKWLTGVRGYKILTIDQPDMIDYYYLCHCTELTILDDGSYPCAFTATFTCDSPYAYAEISPTIYDFVPPSAGFGSFLLDNPSPYSGFLYPKIEIDIEPKNYDPNDTQNGPNNLATWKAKTSKLRFTMTNAFEQDTRSTFSISDFPRINGRLTIDCQTCQLSFEPSSSSDTGPTATQLFSMIEGGFPRIYPAEDIAKAVSDYNDTLSDSWGIGTNKFVVYGNATDTRFRIWVSCKYPVDIGG